jgi:hypothetical protein
VDVGLVETAQLDRRLNADPLAAVPWMVFDSRSPYPDQVWKALVTQTPGPQDTADMARVLAERRKLMRMLRRRAWFERRDEAWRDTLPYRSLEALEEAINPKDPESGLLAKERLKLHIVEAISLLEGVRHPSVRRSAICLRASRAKGATAWSFRLFDASLFTLEVEARPGAARFLEIEADTVTLRASEGLGRAELRLTLDLVEMLGMVRRGFRPNPNDMGGLFVNLLIFRNALLHLPYKSVLVTQDNEKFYEISADYTAQAQLGLKIEERQTSGGEA